MNENGVDVSAQSILAVSYRRSRQAGLFTTTAIEACRIYCIYRITMSIIIVQWLGR